MLKIILTVERAKLNPFTMEEGLQESLHYTSFVFFTICSKSIFLHL